MASGNEPEAAEKNTITEKVLAGVAGKVATNEVEDIRANKKTKEESSPQSDTKKNPTALYHCPHCGRTFTHRSNLLRHGKNQHPEDKERTYLLNQSVKISKHKRVKCPQCTEKFLFRADLTKHMQSRHHLEVSDEKYVFLSNESFLRWKNDMERTTASSFIKQRGARHLKDGTGVAFYYCHRSCRPTRTYTAKKSHATRSGSNNVGKQCPAYIQTETVKCEGWTEIQVSFQRHHAGHKVEVRRLRLPKSERDEIAGQLKQGSSIRQVLGNIAGDINPEPEAADRRTDTGKIVPTVAGKVSKDTRQGCSPQSDTKKNPTALYHCPHCGRTFTHRSNLLRHGKKKHPEDKERTYLLNQSVKTSNHKRVKCPQCTEEFLFRADLTKHIQTRHQLEVSDEKYVFLSNESFLRWKSDVERTTVSSFVKQRGARHLKDGTEVTFYYCHRSGTRTSTAKKRHVKRSGSNKVGKQCPAYIKTETVKREGCTEIQVSFQRHHAGHDVEVRRLRLSKSERDEIAGQLKQGSSIRQVLGNIVGDVNPAKRLSYTTPKDIHNIRMSYGIEQKDTKVEKKSVSVPSKKQFATKAKTWNEDPVLLRFYQSNEENVVCHVVEQSHTLCDTDVIVGFINEKNELVEIPSEVIKVCDQNSLGARRAEIIKTLQALISEAEASSTNKELDVMEEKLSSIIPCLQAVRESSNDSFPDTTPASSTRGIKKVLYGKAKEAQRHGEPQDLENTFTQTVSSIDGS